MSNNNDYWNKLPYAFLTQLFKIVLVYITAECDPFNVSCWVLVATRYRNVG